jgi:DNA polymerase-3 subunit beta
LRGLVGGLPQDQIVEIAQARGADVSVRAGRSRYIVDGLPPADLPQSAALAGATANFTLDREDLARLIEVCQASISTEETRYYLNGLYLHVADSALRAVATTGQCLALHDLPLPAGAVALPSIIVPGSTIEILDKLLRRKPLPESVTIRASDRLIEFAVADLVLTSKLIDGTFPDYARVIPQPAGNRAVVAREALGAALTRVAALIDENAKQINRTVSLLWSDGALHVTRPFDVADDIIEAETTGTGRLAARVSYLGDALEALAGKRVALDSADAGSPIRMTDPDDATSLVIVMPTRG